MTSQSRKQASQPFLPERSDHRLRLQVPRPAAPADGFHQNKGGFTDVCYQYHSEYLSAGSTEQLDFWAPWCGYCRRIAPAFDKIAEEYADTLVAAKVNIDDEPDLAEAEKVEVIPTLILYKGGKAVDSIVAPDSKAAVPQGSAFQITGGLEHE